MDGWKSNSPFLQGRHEGRSTASSVGLVGLKNDIKIILHWEVTARKLYEDSMMLGDISEPGSF